MLDKIWASSLSGVAAVVCCNHNTELGGVPRVIALLSSNVQSSLLEGNVTLG